MSSTAFITGNPLNKAERVKLPITNMDRRWFAVACQDSLVDEKPWFRMMRDERINNRVWMQVGAFCLYSDLL